MPLAVNYKGSEGGMKCAYHWKGDVLIALLYSQSGEVIQPGDDIILEILFQCPKDATRGEIRIKDVLVAGSNNEELTVQTTGIVNWISEEEEIPKKVPIIPELFQSI